MSKLNKELILSYNQLLGASGKLLEELADDPLANENIPNSQNRLAPGSPSNQLDASIRALNKVLDLMTVHLNDASTFLKEEQIKQEKAKEDRIKEERLKEERIEEERIKEEKIKEERLKNEEIKLKQEQRLKEQQQQQQEIKKDDKSDAPPPAPTDMKPKFEFPEPEELKPKAEKLQSPPKIVQNEENGFDFLNLNNGTFGDGLEGFGEGLADGNFLGLTEMEGDPQDRSNILNMIQGIMEDE